ncbi:hypothetical protein [Amycolatopsis samaneae]|uniref:hypothetical protein n=1 Tax=Amycolatopsis samaneae TaxID=664691 RepID=UPI00361C205D
MQQLAAGRVVDVLGAGDEPDPVLAQQQVNGNVIFAVPGQPVDLVHEYVVWSNFFNGLEHLLQLITVVGRSGRLPRVHVLLLDHDAHLPGPRITSLALSRDGVALRTAAAPGLFAGAYPEIREPDLARSVRLTGTTSLLELSDALYRVKGQRPLTKFGLVFVVVSHELPPFG